MEWRWQTMETLSKRELYAILKARQEVFVVDQKIRYVDADGKDFQSYHLSGWKGEELVAYLRVIPGNTAGTYKIGRVLTRLDFRGQGHGEALMHELLQLAARELGRCHLTMAAQLYLEKFYQKFGFVSEGAVFLEEGIQHITMSRDLGA
ncbi:MAG TPA: GNAT family N-acetyltransferase [Oligoflexus sp.]|uniref:GNAT family N-acetyltransferase n=1 Tax=Oligoflexus sp. TaxID=1971216 RepID=UPI002D7EFA7F|nr:GNAT family N-acetyltransferase [Oligoflexus sp.]HET9237787.1 GNAT family N-acetyltransferase [Oligoflexus sp.]